MPLCRLHSGRCPLPNPAEAVSIGVSVPPDPHVPSSWFFPTSTVSSTCQPAGLLHPAADSGVHFVGVRVPKCLHPAKVSPALPVFGVTTESAPRVRFRCVPIRPESDATTLPFRSPCSQSIGSGRGWEACFPCPHCRVASADRTRSVHSPQWTSGTCDNRSPLRQR